MDCANAGLDNPSNHAGNRPSNRNNNANAKGIQMSRTKRHYTKVDQAKFDRIKLLCNNFPDNATVAKIWDNSMDEPLSPNTVDRIRRSDTLEAYKTLSKFMKNTPRQTATQVPTEPQPAQASHRPEVVDAIALKDSIVKLTAAIEKLTTLLDDKNHSTVMRLSPEAPQKPKRLFARNK